MGEYRASALVSRNGTSPVRSRHAAAVLRTDAELLAVALPFLDAGLRAGDAVALTCPPEVAALLCEELGERAGQVRSDPRLSLLGARAPAMTRLLADSNRSPSRQPDATGPKSTSERMRS